MPHGVIDQYRFIVYPLVLGEEKRLFDEGATKLDLDLTNARTTQKGVTLLTYSRK